MKQRIFLCAGFVISSALRFGSRRLSFQFQFADTKHFGVDPSAIATYMDGVIGCANCVTVSSGVAVAQKYSGDKHTSWDRTERQLR